VKKHSKETYSVPSPLSSSFAMLVSRSSLVDPTRSLPPPFLPQLKPFLSLSPSTSHLHGLFFRPPFFSVDHPR
ncbi:hypothetical protein MUK42_33558, partial [Musa troglodytarum]